MGPLFDAPWPGNGPGRLALTGPVFPPSTRYYADNWAEGAAQVAFNWGTDYTY